MRISPRTAPTAAAAIVATLDAIHLATAPTLASAGVLDAVMTYHAFPRLAASILPADAMRGARSRRGYTGTLYRSSTRRRYGGRG
jgi:hypothetical protein